MKQRMIRHLFSAHLSLILGSCNLSKSIKSSFAIETQAIESELPTIWKSSNGQSQTPTIKPIMPNLARQIVGV